MPVLRKVSGALPDLSFELLTIRHPDSPIKQSAGRAREIRRAHAAWLPASSLIWWTKTRETEFRK
ncbi:MAG: hypothetical protein ACKO26_10050 [Planctomycetota bacterium]